MSPTRTDTNGLPIVLSSECFMATPCRDCDVPGYLILRCTLSSESLSELPSQCLDEIGHAIARLEAAIHSLLHPPKIYVLRFSEGFSAVHFHVFPRSEELAAEWRMSTCRGNEQALIGEDIFSWARRHFRVPGPESLSARTLQTAERLQAMLLGLDIGRSV